MWNAPAGTTHLLLVLDPDNRASPSASSKIKALADVRIEYAKGVDSSGASDGTLRAMTDIYRVAGQSLGHINSLVRIPLEQAEIMFKQSLDKSTSSYGPGGQAVLKVYKDMTKGLKPETIRAKAKKDEIVKAMVAEINVQMDAGNIVSKHLVDPCKVNAVDVGRNWITQTYGALGRLRFVEAACADLRKKRMGGLIPFEGCASFEDPTYHLDFPQSPENLVDCEKRRAAPLQGPWAEQSRSRSALASISAALPQSERIDLSSGAFTAKGNVAKNRVELTFDAHAADLLSVSVNTIETILTSEAQDDDSMVFLLDTEGHVLASNDDSEIRGLSASLEDVEIPETGTYTIVITTFPNMPLLDVDGTVRGWPNEGTSSIVFEAALFLIKKTGPLYLHQIEGYGWALEWNVQGSLQESPSVAGPWADLSAAISPHLVIMQDKQWFYRLQPR